MFQVGDNVGLKCAVQRPVWLPSGPWPVVGVVYKVSWVGVTEDDDRDEIIDLLELPSPEVCVTFSGKTGVVHRGYIAEAFRKIITRKTDISCFTEILDKVSRGDRKLIGAE